MPTLCSARVPFEREFVGRNRRLGRADHVLGGAEAGISGARVGDDRAFGGGDLLERAALARLRLADARAGLAALEQRQGRLQAGAWRSGRVWANCWATVPLPSVFEIIGVIAAGEGGQARQPRRARDADVVIGRPRLLARGFERGIVVDRDIDRVVRARRERRQRRRRLEILGKLADDAQVILAARLQLRLGALQLAARLRQPRVGLGDVGAGEIADLEAIARGLCVRLQHAHVAAVELDDRLVADHVHIGARRSR